MAKDHPTHVHRVKLSDFRDRKADEGAIDIETDDGAVYRIPAAELWPDDVLACIETDPIRAAQLLIGVDEYAAFAAAGGSASLVMGIIKDVHGATAGESPASSSS